MRMEWLLALLDNLVFTEFENKKLQNWFPSPQLQNEMFLFFLPRNNISPSVLTEAEVMSALPQLNTYSDISIRELFYMQWTPFKVSSNVITGQGYTTHIQVEKEGISLFQTEFRLNVVSGRRLTICASAFCKFFLLSATEENFLWTPG